MPVEIDDRRGCVCYRTYKTQMFCAGLNDKSIEIFCCIDSTAEMLYFNFFLKIASRLCINK